MINKEEKKLEKEQENYKDITIDDNKNNNLIKENLIKFLEIQLKESEEKILEVEMITEKEIISVYNRLDKEIEKARKFSLEKLIIDFLPIIDNIERALNIIETNKSDTNYIAIFKQLKNTSDLLKKFFTLLQVKKIDDINISFNPTIHEAMSIHYTDEMESNQIVTVMQPGYLLHESRLLRPAMVMVSKKKT
ncbi:nucleotide exchange factor GrpE [Buchnera aphidicola (Hyperomyzus lactucae)]|uniref:Protein GrpE n=1 Tax=Buchnera aphidicola (Hyperomyzus lactucae) TaxID=1241860 RepID=A0A4D6XUL1_9GAMM|nr:nucleotide exchange factor GrpE [Buchnera aphidicola]QCI20976.1 nucleotide exchange factor GrpE [Buchnera aphidicola (Hyperomyzus lactucae)]